MGHAHSREMSEELVDFAKRNRTMYGEIEDAGGWVIGEIPFQMKTKHFKGKITSTRVIRFQSQKEHALCMAKFLE